MGTPAEYATNSEQENAGTQPHAHVVRFYASDAAVVNELVTFVATALRLGDSALVIATEGHRQAMMKQLQARRCGLTRALREGRLINLDAEATLAKVLVDGFPDGERFRQCIAPAIEQARRAAAKKSRQVVAFGEMVTLLAASGRFDAAIHLEQLWNGLASTQVFTLHCAYPIHLFSDTARHELLLRVCREHSDVIPA